MKMQSSIITRSRYKETQFSRREEEDGEEFDANEVYENEEEVYDNADGFIQNLDEDDEGFEADEENQGEGFEEDAESAAAGQRITNMLDSLLAMNMQKSSAREELESTLTSFEEARKQVKGIANSLPQV
jgi:hypothetical protein